MANYALREVQYATEGSFAENASAPASNTWTKRIPVTAANLTLGQDRMSDGSIQARQNESRPGHLGVRTATLELTSYLPGHLTATTGALTETWLQDLLSDGLGGGNVAQVGGTVNTPTSAIQFSVTSATCVAGAIIRVGAKGDARGDGQAGVVNNATTVTLLTALPASPNAADVVYACQMAYPTEDPTTTKRFLIGWPATGAQYHLMGCQLDGLSLAVQPGTLPTITLRYQCAYWARYAVTIPSAVTLEACETQPVAGGSVFLQTAGTTTRAVVSPSSIDLAIDLGLAPKVGPAVGQAAYQSINGWERTRCVPSLTMMLPWSTTYETLYDTDGGDTTQQQILATLSVGNGSRSSGFYLPRAYVVSPKPIVADNGGLLYQSIKWQGREGLVTTNDLTQSAIRFFMG